MKPKNAGYIAGDNWETCERCGQAFRSSDMRTQWDGLRVCLNDYDKRHPQDMVRDTEFACDSTKGGFADNSPGNRLLIPDLDPLAFVQEPNDEYFTDIPTTTFSRGSTVEVADASQLTCSSDIIPWPLYGWYIMEERVDIFGVDPAYNSIEPFPVNCDDEVISISSTCYELGVGALYGKIITTATNGPTYECAAHNTTNYGDIPAVKFDKDDPSCYLTASDMGFLLGLQFTPTFQNADDPDWTNYYVMSIEDTSNGDRTIITGSDVSEPGTGTGQPDEGYRIYTIGGKTYFGLRIPAESWQNPDHEYDCTVEFPTISLNPEAIDKDWQFFEVPMNEPFLLEVRYTIDATYFKCWTLDGTVSTYTFKDQLTIDCYNNAKASVNGQYVPLRGHTFNWDNGIGWNLYECAIMINPRNVKVYESEREVFRNYISWKYEIPIDTLNYT